MMKKILFVIGCVGCVYGASAAHIRETFKLEKGWNAIYIESTPENSGCEEFFRDLPVVAAAAYRSEADASTAQLAEDGSEIVQQPVTYLQWVRGASVSTLNSIVGGRAYLIFATNAVDEVSFLGVPTVPRIIWRKISSAQTDEILNFAGVSSVLPSQSAASYFGEGPFGMVTAGRQVYVIGGTDPNGPTLKALGSFGKVGSVEPGKAYALTASSAGDWPGVIGVVSRREVAFASDTSLASVTLQNRGTQERTFNLRVVPSALETETMPPLRRRLPRVDAISAPEYTNVVASAAWTVDLKPEATADQVFAVDRMGLVEGVTYGAVLEITDLGGSGMRVRLPIIVAANPAEDAENAYPYGLWTGAIALDAVSQLTNDTPVAAGGTMTLNVMIHNAKDGGPNGLARLLQRVAAGVETNGAIRLYRELKDVPTDLGMRKRFSVAFPGVSNPQVAADAGSEGFGKMLRFTWTVDAGAGDNPFRHAGHPDHDGLGDRGATEVWSLTNTLTLSWHQDGNPGKPVDFAYQPGERTQGYVTYEVEGLVSPGPIRATGVFSLQRTLKVGKIEK